MDTIVHLAVTPEADAKITPLELLEDFADASRGWHYLEDDSAHYADERSAPACVLRHYHQQSDTVDFAHVDFAFAATDPGNPNDIELVLLDSPTPERTLDLDERNQVIDAFVDDFQGYLGGRPGHASLRIARDDVDPAAFAS